MPKSREIILLDNSHPQDNVEDIVILSDEEDRPTLSETREDIENVVHFSDDSSDCSCGRGSKRKIVQLMKKRLREKEEELKRLRKNLEKKSLRKRLLPQILSTKPVEEREIAELIGKVRELRKGWELKDEELTNVKKELAEAKSLLCQAEVENKTTKKLEESMKARIKLYKKSATLLPKLSAEYGKRNVEMQELATANKVCTEKIKEYELQIKEANKMEEEANKIKCEHQNTIKGLIQDKENLTLQNKQLNTEILDLRSTYDMNQVKEMSEAVLRLKSDFANLKKENENVMRNNEEFISENIELNSVNGILRSRITETNENMENIKSELDEIKTNLKLKDTKVMTLNYELAEKLEEKEAKVNYYDTVLIETNSSFEQVNKRYQDTLLKLNILEMEKKFVSYKLENAKDIENENNGLKSMVAALQGSITEIEKNINEHKEEKLILEKKQIQQHSRSLTLVQTIDELRIQNEDQEEKMNILKNKLVHYEEAIKDLKNSNEQYCIAANVHKNELEAAVLSTMDAEVIRDAVQQENIELIKQKEMEYQKHKADSEHLVEDLTKELNNLSQVKQDNEKMIINLTKQTQKLNKQLCNAKQQIVNLTNLPSVLPGGVSEAKSIDEKPVPKPLLPGRLSVSRTEETYNVTQEDLNKDEVIKTKKENYAKCEKCNYIASSDTDLKAHTNIAHIKRLPFSSPSSSTYLPNIFPCKYCFFTAKHNKEILDKHVDKMHKGGKDAKFEIVNDDSKPVFSEANYVLSEDRSSFQCHACSSEGRAGVSLPVFPGAGHLRTVQLHFQRRHTGTAFRCTKCGETCRTKGSIDNHIQELHG